MKRIFSAILALSIAFTCCYGGVFAKGAQTRASLTLSAYSAGLKAGSSGGTISISYDVQASKWADSVGVESIAIYRSNGSYVTTIAGTTSNGLICADSNIHKGTYSYVGTSGVSYYAKVTVFAEVGANYDRRTVTTSTVKAL